MPFLLILVGMGLMAAVIRGQEQRLFRVLGDDFTGQNNFVAWLFAVILLGIVGNTWESAKPVATAFLVLVVIALLISQQGFWEKFKEQALQ